MQSNHQDFTIYLFICNYLFVISNQATVSNKKSKKTNDWTKQTKAKSALGYTISVVFLLSCFHF